MKLIIIAVLLNSMSAFAEVPVLSIDELGNETTTIISDDDYMKVTALSADAMAMVAEDQIAIAPMTTHLTLRGIQVGIEALGSLGPAPWKLGTGINQQFYFELKN